jgi:streptogramin lyase
VEALEERCLLAAITEFGSGITPGSNPSAITLGADGNLWFTETNANALARITPGGTVTEFSLAALQAGSGPVGITSGPNGLLYFTESSVGRIGSINPKAGSDAAVLASLTQSAVVPSGANVGPRGIDGITAGPDGNLWFTEGAHNVVGRIGAQLSPITEFLVPMNGADPEGIAAGPDGALWFTEDAADQIGRITPSGAIAEFPLPSNGGPQGIAAGPDGNLWFAEASGGQVGKITPSGAITEFPLPTQSTPSFITSGPDGNLWFTEYGSNRIGRITPAGGVTEYSTGLTANAQLGDITAGPDGNLWFTENAANQVGRLIPDAPLTATGVSVSAVAASPFSGPVASFTDGDTTAAPADFTATIDWGDGTRTGGTVAAASGQPGGFVVSGSHTFATAGGYTATVTITDTNTTSSVGGNIATAVDPVTCSNGPSVTLNGVEVQPSSALSSSTYADIPGLIMKAPSAGLYHVSASTTIQNTSATAATEVSVEILANGQPVDLRLLSFAPNSPTSQQSLTLEDNLPLNAGDPVEVQATAATGSAVFPGTNAKQDLRLIQFNDIPGSGPGVSFGGVAGQPSGNLTPNAFATIPGLTTNVTAAGTYHVSVSTTIQNTSDTAGTEVGVEILANGQPVDLRLLSFAPNSPTSQQSLDAEDDLSLTAGELVQVQAAAFTGSARFATNNNSLQALRLIQFNDIPGSGPGVALTKVEVQPGAPVTSGGFSTIPGLTAKVTAAGTYLVSASTTFQNTSTTGGTEVGVNLVVNDTTIVDSRLLSFAPNSPTSQQSLTLEDDLPLNAGDQVEVQATAFTGSAQFSTNNNSPQDLRLIRFATPPVVTNPGSQTSTAGATTTLGITARDVDGGPLTYGASGLPAGLTINSVTGVISGTISAQAGRAAAYAVTVTASDGFNSGSTSFNWAVMNSSVLQFSAADYSINESGGSATITLSRTGGTAGVVSVQVSTGGGTATAGTDYTAISQTISWADGDGTPKTVLVPILDEGRTAGKRTVNLSLTSPGGGASLGGPVTGVLTILDNDTPPGITSAAGASFTVGTAGSFTVTASGAPTPALSESGGLPGGISFNPSTGVLSGTPASGSGRIYRLQFTAHNIITPDATQDFTLTVAQVPAFTNLSSTTFTAGAPGNFTIAASGFPVPTLSESAGDTLPGGVSFDATTGVLSGTPVPGSGKVYPLHFTATSGAGSVSQTFTLTVDEAPAFSSPNGDTLLAGSPGSFRVTATGFPPPTLSESVIDTLPPGLTFNPAVGGVGGAAVGLLSGTPAATSGGSYTLHFAATNGVGVGTVQTFTLTVDQAPSFASPTGAAFTAGASGAFRVSVLGFPAPTVSESGALPAGVTFDPASGVLGGTPAPGTAGTYAVSLSAGNGVGSTATQTFTLTVTAPAPSVPPPVTGPLNLAGLVSVSVGPLTSVGKRRKTGGSFTQMLTVTNNGPSAIQGPIVLVLDSLAPRKKVRKKFVPQVTVAGAGGTTQAVSPGSPFVAGPALLPAGGTFSFRLVFQRRGAGTITFNPVLLAGYTQP